MILDDNTSFACHGSVTFAVCSRAIDLKNSNKVVPGDSDKLLLYFQGGGACWDAASTDLQFCTSTCSPNSLSGVFDRSNAANPFKDHTIVHVLYCSGDLHAGNVTRPYSDGKGEPVEQRGFYNTRASVDWAKANLDAHLSSLVMSGCSAGSLGVQAWAAELLEELSYDNAAVVRASAAWTHLSHHR